MTHRIREAMRETGRGPLGGGGRTIEADETYFGKNENRPTRTTRGGAFTKRGKGGPSGKRAVVALSSAAARSALSISSVQSKRPSTKSSLITLRASHGCTPMKAASTSAPIRISKRSRRSSTPRKNTCPAISRPTRMGLSGRKAFTPTQRRMCFRCSSGV